MERQSTIVLIEDEPAIQEIVEYNLRREGYRVHCCADGEKGLRSVRELLPDLVVLDLMLPGLDGIEVCRKLRKDPATRGMPVLMLTAKSEESDVVLGLGVGADDYVSKPFSPRELIARVKALLRRGPLKDEDGESRLLRGPLVLDPARHEATIDDASLGLTATEFKLAYALARHPGRVFSREQLVNACIGEDRYVIDRNIDVHIRALRKKLGEARDLIETIRGVGYRFSDQGK
jgi:DNA-binding response OmpR family regulator